MAKQKQRNITIYVPHEADIARLRDGLKLLAEEVGATNDNRPRTITVGALVCLLAEVAQDPDMRKAIARLL